MEQPTTQPQIGAKRYVLASEMSVAWRHHTGQWQHAGQVRCFQFCRRDYNCILIQSKILHFNFAHITCSWPNGSPASWPSLFHTRADIDSLRGQYWWPWWTRVTAVYFNAPHTICCTACETDTTCTTLSHIMQMNICGHNRTKRAMEHKHRVNSPILIFHL